MKIKDVLFKKTLVRVGPDEMRGVVRLIEGKHTGIAEKHCVAKLFDYVEELESRLGITVPDPDSGNIDRRFIKINSATGTYFQPASA